MIENKYFKPPLSIVSFFTSFWLVPSWCHELSGVCIRLL